MKKQLLIIAASLALIPSGQLFAFQNASLISKTETLIAKNISHNQAKDSLSKSGDKKYKSKDYRGAIADYTKILLQNPNDTYALFQRALSKSKSGDHQGAILDYSAVIRINPEYYSAFYNRGLSKEKIKDPYGAISDYNKALSIKEDHENARINRAWAKSDIGDHKGGIKDFSYLWLLFVYLA